MSFDANPNTGVPIYDSYDFGTGTGLDGHRRHQPFRPLLVGPDCDRRTRLRVGQSLGTLNGTTQTIPELYSLPAADFHDVTAGYNANFPGYGYFGSTYDSESSGDKTNGYPDAGFAAKPGYDEATGLGTPVANLIAAGFLNPVATTTTLTVSAASSTYGQPLTIKAAVAVVSPQTGTPSGGTVTFMEGTTTIGSAPVSSGTATVTLSTLPAGLGTLSASYSGFSGTVSGTFYNFAASSTNGQAAALLTVAGGGPLSTAGTTLSPFGVAIDSSGNLYLADPKHNRVARGDSRAAAR